MKYTDKKESKNITKRKVFCSKDCIYSGRIYTLRNSGCAKYSDYICFATAKLRKVDYITGERYFDGLVNCGERNNINIGM